VGAGDDDVDFICAGFYGAADFVDTLRERRKAGGESGRDGSYGNAAAFQGAASDFYESVIDADSGNFDFERFDGELSYQLVRDGLAGFAAKAANAFVSVVAGKRRQIHAGDGSKKPGCLPIFFYRAARSEGLGAAFDGAGVDAHVFDPIEIEWNAAICFKGPASQVSEGGIRGRNRRFRCALVHTRRAAGRSGYVGHLGILLGEGRFSVQEKSYHFGGGCLQVYAVNLPLLFEISAIHE